MCNQHHYTTDCLRELGLVCTAVNPLLQCEGLALDFALNVDPGLLNGVSNQMALAVLQV